MAKAVMKILPQYDITYLGDTARTPYGNKSPRVVIDYAIQNADFISKKGAKIIIIACNTASSVAFASIVKRFNIPIFEVIDPAVEWSLKESKSLRIGVIGTRTTVATGIYEKKIKQIKQKAKVFSKACPLLVPLVEEGWLKKPETTMIVKKYLHSLKVKKIDTLILGCTHYPLLKNIIQRKIGKRVTVIDSSDAVAARVKELLEKNQSLDLSMKKNKVFDLYVSDRTSQFEKTAKEILGKKISLQDVRL